MAWAPWRGARRSGDVAWACLGMCTLAGVALLAQAPSPQDARPTFRSGVSLVEVTALVTDRSDRPVGGLGVADFEVFEDGERRPIASVRFLEAKRPSLTVPMPAGVEGIRREEVVTNRALADAPVFVLLLDDLNVSPYDAHRAIGAGLGVLAAVPQDALLSAVTTSGDGGSILTFTPPSQEHEAIVRAFRGRLILAGPKLKNGLGIATTASSVDAPCGVGSEVLNSPDCSDPTRVARRSATIEAIGKLLARAGSRRKVLFWLTTDAGVSPLDPRGNREAQIVALERALGSDVTVYPVDPRENYTEPHNGIDRRTGGSMRVGTSDTVFQGRGGSTMMLGTDDMVGVPLSQIARETGGRWIQHANDLDKLLGTIVTQNTSTYLLAYESPVSNVPGRRRIEVRTTRKGLKVASRRAYIVRPSEENADAPASVGDIATLLHDTILGTVPQGTLALRVHAAPQFVVGAAGRVLVTIAVDPDSVGDATGVELQVLTVDAEGKVGNGQRLALTPPPSGQEWEGSITLPVTEGRHQLRVAAVTPDGGRTGLVLQPLHVMAATRDRLLGVPVLLGHDANGVRPTLARTFPVGHPLAFQVEAARHSATRDVAAVHGRLVDRAGRTVREEPAAAEDAGMSTHRRATGVLATGDLSPGTYTLLVEARRPDGTTGAAHAIPVHLEPATDATARRESSPAPVGPNLTPLSVASGPLARTAHRGPLVIRTEEAWAAFWRTLPTRQTPPDIDFTRVTLLAIVADDPPGMPRITAVRPEAGGILVQWTTSPIDGRTEETEPLRPFVVMGLTSAEGRVRFERAP